MKFGRDPWWKKIVLLSPLASILYFSNKASILFEFMSSRCLSLVLGHILFTSASASQLCYFHRLSIRPKKDYWFRIIFIILFCVNIHATQNISERVQWIADFWRDAFWFHVNCYFSLHLLILPLFIYYIRAYSYSVKKYTFCNVFVFNQKIYVVSNDVPCFFILD
jgi:hypothetical protein